MNEKKTETVEEIVDLSLDELLEIPGADSIITSKTTSEKKPNIFSSKNVDLSFLNEDKTNEKENEKIENKSEKIDKKEVDKLLNIDSSISNDDVKTKSSFNNVLKSLIEEEYLLPFTNDKGEPESIDNYTEEEIKDLLKSNFENIKTSFEQETPKQFFESQPYEIQLAMKYVADGGKDLKSLFKYLSKSEEIKALSLDTEQDQEQIIREYLNSTNFGSAEDIEEEIETWKDLGKLEEKASKFKPKLDEMQEKIIQQRLAEQETKRKQQEKAVQHYRDSIFETLKKGNLNGVELDKKIQAKLFAGLIQPNYPSITGNNTNLLGHLLEKYQYIEPRHDLIAEALWLLSDPDNYKEKIKTIGGQTQVEKTVKQLKTTEQNKNNDSEINLKENKKTLVKPNSNFFKF